jgi:galactofuranosylgalactofuranosylrhamnosyl-N-acetylglucosaminyl-diphospho-decaprenol beta-1,5/1,6-galactofuranosyltransferase
VSEPCLTICPSESTRRADTCALQEFVLSAPADRRALYWRRDNSVDSTADPSDAPIARHGEVLSFDTFVNSFYASYWAELAGPLPLRLTTETSGACTIRVIQTGAGRRHVLQQIDADGAHAISTTDLLRGDGVLHLEVEARSGAAASLHRAAWMSDAPSRFPVRLTIVTCSFGREGQLSENLKTIAPCVSARSEISEVIVVHQGERALESVPLFAALTAADAFQGKLRVIRQANFGGSGGFGRGMLETLAGDSTHVLLLDDDIEIDAAMLPRLIALLRHTGPETIIGGQMLNLRRPTMLSASNETMDLVTMDGENPLHGVDLAQPGAAGAFARVRTSDYNAWWMCCLPVGLLRRVGLPLPFFIRHDDTEHGVRCTAAGARTVTMPGLFVWHQPFDEGRSPWISYYDRRNKMIASAAHGRLSLVHALRWYFRDMRRALALHQYGFCLANCLAVEHFLAGPEAVFSTPRTTHDRLRADQAQSVLLAAVLRRLAAKQPRQAPVLEPSLLRTTLALSIGAVRGQARERTSARSALALHARTWWAAVLLALFCRRVARHYRSTARSYTEPAFWLAYLGLPQDGSRT